MDREAIIRKINAMRELANHPSTEPNLVAVSIAKYEALMAKYNLSLTDLEIKEAGISISGAKKENGGSTRHTRHPMGFVVLGIAELTDTKLVALKGLNGWHFVGLPSDVQYATWIYDLVRNSMEQGSIKYKISVDYHRAINNGTKGSDAIHNYKLGFAFAVADSIQKLIQEHKKAGTGLVVLKNDLILSFLNEQGKKAANPMGGKGIALQDHTRDIREMGYKEGEKVKVRQGVAESNPVAYIK